MIRFTNLLIKLFIFPDFKVKLDFFYNNKRTYPSSIYFEKKKKKLYFLFFYQDEDESRDKQKLVLSEKAEWQYSDREKENLDVFYTRYFMFNKQGCYQTFAHRGGGS